MLASGHSQQPDPNGDTKQEEPTIQDNSFLVEEAYNQEFGVVQHIQTFQRLFDSKDWAYSFTQEWPIDKDPRHQLSYTFVATRIGEFSGSGAGVGDFAVNYRFQLIGNGDTRFAFSPRVSLLAPTGDSRFGRGLGGAAVQMQLPFSAVINKQLTTHWNVGTTLAPNSRNEFGDKAFSHNANLGQSFIWTAKPRFNVVLETVFYSNEAVVAPGRTIRENSVFLNPGVRWAYNLKSGMQIVPGISVPVGIGPSSGERGIFFYFSIEHPYRRLDKK